MHIPDVLNTLLLGLILVVIVVTVVRPIVLGLVQVGSDQPRTHRLLQDQVDRHLTHYFEREAEEMSKRIRYQQLLLNVPDKTAHEDEIDWDAIEAQEAAEAAQAAAAQAEEAALAAEVSEAGVEIQEGESLAEVKERLKREQQQAKKPVIPPELLQGANSYEDKVGVVRMVGQADKERVASLVRSMLQADLSR